MHHWLEYLRTSLFIALVTTLVAQSQVPSYEVELTKLLSDVVSEDGLVDYTRLRENPERLEGILSDLAQFSGPLETDEQKKAFWINAYNAHMINFIVAAPDVYDIIEDGYADQFFKTRVNVAGHEVSLDEIEHKILRRTDSSLPAELMADKLDPRIHVGLNCGAISCPSLTRRAFSAATVDEMLDEQMRVFVNSGKHFRIEDDSLVLSSLLDWFGDDWDSTGIPAGDYLLGYMDSARPNYEQISGVIRGNSSSEIRRLPSKRFEYKWIVNDISLHQ